MEKWIIKNDKGIIAGYVLYNKSDRSWEVSITNTKDEVIPAQLIVARSMGNMKLTKDQSYGFIKDRVIPERRQNIEEIMEANNIPYYDEYFFIKVGNGKCTRDDFYFEPVEMED